MRIGLLTDCYRPGVNGIIRFLILHKHTLEEMGHQVYLFTWGHPHPEDEKGVVRSAGLPFPRPGYHLGFGYSRHAEALLRTMDILHANQPLMSGALAVRLGRRYSIPVVLTCHSRYDLLLATVFPFLPRGAHRSALRPIFRWITDRCDLVITTTTEAARVMADLGVAHRIEVVPIGVEIGCPSQRSLTRRDLGIDPDVPLAISFGRLSPEKDVGMLLQAMAQPELARAHLLVVGDGAERRALESQCRGLGLDGRVQFAGEVPLADIPAYAALADLFVTASRIEMLPASVLEALAAGLPVIGLDVPWIRAVVHPGINGLLAEPEVTALAHAWASLLENESLRTRLSAGARAASTQYDVRRTTALLATHYQRLVAARQGRTDAGSPSD